MTSKLKKLKQKIERERERLGNRWWGHYSHHEMERRVAMAGGTSAPPVGNQRKKRVHLWMNEQDQNLAKGSEDCSQAFSVSSDDSAVMDSDGLHLDFASNQDAGANEPAEMVMSVMPRMDADDNQARIHDLHFSSCLL